VADKIDGDTPDDEPRKPKFDWWIRFVSYCKRKLEERRAKNEKQDPTERAARSTARASWVMAVFTAVIAFVGILQWAVIRAQLGEMQKAGELTEEMIDTPVWLTGVKAFQFSDSGAGGVATTDLLLKNAGRQFGILEIVDIGIEIRRGYDTPDPGAPLDPHGMNCFDFVLGELTFLPNDQRTLHMICLPPFKRGQVADIRAAKQFLYLKAFAIYYDSRRVFHEKSTLFVFRPATKGVKDHFIPLGSRDVKVPVEVTAKIQDMQRGLYRVMLKSLTTLEKKAQAEGGQKHPTPPAPKSDKKPVPAPH